MICTEVNGFNVIGLKLPTRITSVRVVASGTGSLFETNPADYGVAHFLEHMAFKNTKTKSCIEIGRLLDKLGGHNAMTGYEDTKYYVNCRNKHWPSAFKLLCELLFETVFDEEEFAKEKQVILEEIQTIKDDPVNNFFEQAFSNMYEDMHPIIGDFDSVGEMTSMQLANYKQKNYGKKNLLFIVAGDIDLDAFPDICKSILTYNMHSGELRKKPDLKFSTEPFKATFSCQQGIFAIAMPGYTEKESVDHNFVDLVFNHGFGQASSSVMYERIRQQLGLCYHTSSYTQQIVNRKLFMCYGLLSPNNIPVAFEEVDKLLNEVRKNGFREDSLDIYKENLIHHLSALETAAQHCGTFVDNWLSEEYHIGPDETASMIETVTNDDIKDYANFIGSLGKKFLTLNEID